LILTLALGFSAGDWSAQEEQGPRLRVLSPAKGYILGGLNERKVSIVVEVTCSELGLLTTDTGAVRFVEPNRNTRLFADHVVARTEYTNNLGQTVVQVISVIPAAKLELSDFTVNPPIAFNEIRPKEGEQKFSVPREAMAEAAVFNFQVQDLGGHRSSLDQGKLIIGLATEVWRPKPPPKDAP
jgi:hypothetical protein